MASERERLQALAIAQALGKTAAQIGQGEAALRVHSRAMERDGIALRQLLTSQAAQEAPELAARIEADTASIITHKATRAAARAAVAGGNPWTYSPRTPNRTLESLDWSARVCRR